MFFQFIVGPSLPAFTGLIPKLLEAKLLENVKHNMTHNEGADLLSHDFSVLPPILWYLAVLNVPVICIHFST